MKAEARRGNLGEDPKSPYYEKRKYPEPTVCPRCKLTYRKGRWAPVEESPLNANEELCPACRRITDGEPGGLVYLEGTYLRDRAKTVEILNVAKNQEKLARRSRPMQRIMWVKRNGDLIELATTNVHLAQRIGKAVHDAHSGELEIKYTEGQRFARVYWRRDD